MHTNATHDPDWKPEGNISPIEDPDPTPHQPIQLRFEEPTDDDLVFTGMNHTPVLMIPQSLNDRERGNGMKEACNGHEVVISNYHREIKFHATGGHGPRNHVIDLTLLSKIQNSLTYMKTCR